MSASWVAGRGPSGSVLLMDTALDSKGGSHGGDHEEGRCPFALGEG